MSSAPHSARRGGYTFIETCLALGAFFVLGYSLVVALDIGDDSQRSVARVALDNRAVRDTRRALVDELRSAREASIQVATLPDGNHQVTFMLPIQVEGANTWGVNDRQLGGRPSEWSREDWSVRYTVVNVEDGQAIEKQLVRQVLDDEGDVQRQETIARGLNSGSGAWPGFHVVKNGAMWEVSLSTVAQPGCAAGEHEVFHVQTRNAD